MLASAVCLGTREMLDGVLKYYNALVREDGTIPPKATTTFVFNQIFEAGRELKPKCNCCGKYIAEHQSAGKPVSALLMWKVEGALPAWRRIIGLREKVVNKAILLGARGTICPNGLDIDVCVFFPTREAAFNFVFAVRETASFYSLGNSMPNPIQESLENELPFVAPYACADPPSSDQTLSSVSLTQTAKKELESEVQTFQCVESGNYLELVHIIPHVLLKDGKRVGSWCLLAGTSIFNKMMTNRPLPDVRITHSGISSVARNTSRTEVRFRIICLSIPVFAELRRSIVRTAAIFEDALTFELSVFVKTEWLQLFVDALTWRDECWSAAADLQRKATPLQNNNKAPSSDWFYQVPLAKFRSLSDYAKALSSPRLDYLKKKERKRFRGESKGRKSEREKKKKNRKERDNEPKDVDSSSNSS